MEIKDIINQRKEELNLTFADIAKACNVSEATVSESLINKGFFDVLIHRL